MSYARGVNLRCRMLEVNLPRRRMPVRRRRRRRCGGAVFRSELVVGYREGGMPVRSRSLPRWLLYRGDSASSLRALPGYRSDWRPTVSSLRHSRFPYPTQHADCIANPFEHAPTFWGKNYLDLVWGHLCSGYFILRTPLLKPQGDTWSMVK